MYDIDEFRFKLKVFLMVIMIWEFPVEISESAWRYGDLGIQRERQPWPLSHTSKSDIVIILISHPHIYLTLSKMRSEDPTWFEIIPEPIESPTPDGLFTLSCNL